MHNKAVAVYERDVVDEVLAFLSDAAERCVRAGIPAEHVILDPGIGFGKLPEHNLALLGALDRASWRSAFRRWSGPRASRRSAN
jgi:dihydropteroate synthase